MCLIILIFGIDLLLPRDENLFTSYINYPLLAALIILPIIACIAILKNNGIKAFLTYLIVMFFILINAINSIGMAELYLNVFIFPIIMGITYLGFVI